MNLKARSDALRAMLGALLESNLTLRELHDLSRELLVGSLPKDLSSLLSDALSHLGRSDTGKRLSESESTDSAAYAAAQKQRMSKRELIEIIGAISPKFASRPGIGNLSAREILKNFSRIATDQEISELLRLLGDSDASDAYLKGITRRS